MGRRWRGLRDGCGQREEHGKEGSTCPEVCQTVPHSTGVVLEYMCGLVLSTVRVRTVGYIQGIR